MRVVDGPISIRMDPASLSELRTPVNEGTLVCLTRKT